MTSRSHAETTIFITLPGRDWKALKDAAFAISVSPITSRKRKQLSSQVVAILGKALASDDAKTGVASAATVTASGDAKTVTAFGDLKTVTVARPLSSWTNLLSLFAEAPAGVLHRAAWDASEKLHRKVRELERPKKREPASVPDEQMAGA